MYEIQFFQKFLSDFFDQKAIFAWILCTKGVNNTLFLKVRKEVNSMEQPSFDKTTVEHQYDTLIKKVLIGEATVLRTRLSKSAIS